ncbi:MAG: hypothetical protein DRP82_01535 [Planctomycetota bacterium]|nr:MAG: hypothetical protein DRP82_01535 [Planctomycetota bacterium]
MRCAVVVAVVAVCGPLFAQAGKLDVRWRIWEPETSASIQADSTTLASDVIRHTTFKWNRDKALDRLDVTLPWRRSRIFFAWWQAVYAGTRDLSDIFTYAGVQYDAGTSLYCRFRTLNYSARWEHDLTTAGRSAVISGGFGLLFFRYYLRLEGVASGLPQHDVWRFDRTFPYLSLSIYTITRTRMGNLFVGASVLFSGGLKFGSTHLKSFSETCLFFNLVVSGVGVQLGVINHSLETTIATGSLRHKIRYSMPGPFIGFSVWF